MKRTRIAILCGGMSGEHQVSLISAFNIAEALSSLDQYEVTLIGLRRDGTWCWQPQGDLLCEVKDVRKVHLHPDALSLRPGTQGQLLDEQGQMQLQVDVFFPITHGTYGEDGSLQGWLRMLQAPFVGCDVWGSAVCMDKDLTKRLLAHAGIPVTPFVTLRLGDKLSYTDAISQLGLPFFVKPCREGSSLGVSKVRNEEQYQQALEQAFALDHKVLLEQGIVGREIEAAVLGNDQPEVATVLGEIVPTHEFYSYEAKYVDADGAVLTIPATLDETTAQQIRELAKEAFRVTECQGMARVDFFLAQDQQIYLNELNTLPGFTSISMYPKLWQASGLSYPELLDRLVQLALERHQ